MDAGGDLKARCWLVEPVKAQYAVADAALDYVCGPGYYGMLTSWFHYLPFLSLREGEIVRAAGTASSRRPPARISSPARRGSWRTPAAAPTPTSARDRGPARSSPFPYPYPQKARRAEHRVLGEYMECIREPIFEQCGAAAWTQVKEAVQRPTRVYLPYCTLAGPASSPSALLTALAAALYAILR